MRRLLLTTMICLAVLALAATAMAGDRKFELSSHTGTLLRGTVYKYSGAERSGVITVKFLSKIPGEKPTLRYDFDMLHGKMADNLYSYLMADVASMQFLPMEDGEQSANIVLRNGAALKIKLTTPNKPLIGPVNLTLTEVVVETDGYGENIITGGDVHRIVFDSPEAARDAEMSRLVDDLGQALEVGKRDNLVDTEFIKVLENIHGLMKARLTDGENK